MGAAKYVAKNERLIFKDPKRRKELLNELANRPAIYRVKGPTRLFRAHALGYKAKQGYFVVRVRVAKGLFRRERPNHARHPSKAGIFYALDISKQQIAEQRVAKKYPNAEVLGSYYLVENGEYKWFEVILKDRSVN
jgi:large subunit ribosomal protein L15e